MCKFCDFYRTDIDGVEYATESIIEGRYESCMLVKKDNEFFILLSGSYEYFSDPIKYCPFCGKDLEQEIIY